MSRDYPILPILSKIWDWKPGIEVARILRREREEGNLNLTYARPRHLQDVKPTVSAFKRIVHFASACGRLPAFHTAAHTRNETGNLEERRARRGCAG